MEFKMNKLILGNCNDYLGTLEYDYIFTSPPDFEEIGSDPSKPNEYQDFLKEIFSKAKPKNGLITVAFTDRKYKGTIIPKSSLLKEVMFDMKYKLVSHKIWVKSKTIDLFRLTYGNVLTFGIGTTKQYMDKEFKADVWIDGYGKYKKFSYGMPVDVPRKCILNYTKENDIVYDPFMGSGTTAVAAFRTNRQYLGTELSEDYWNLSVERLNEETDNITKFC